MKEAGTLNTGSTTDATSVIIHATIKYAIPALNTLRLFSPAMYVFRFIGAPWLVVAQ